MKYLIVKPNCRELANHLWNYLSIYAYGLETQASAQNPSFIEWHRYFDLVRKESLFTRVVAQFPALHGIWNMACKLYGSYLVRFHASCVRLTLGITMYLPPTRKLLTPGNESGTTHFIGWHFRNPVGLEKYRAVLTAAFMPTGSVLAEITKVLAPFKGKKLIGVHLRQEPYRGFKDGTFLVTPRQMRQIIEEYLRETNTSARDVALVVVSDKKVDPAVFHGFAAHTRCGNDVTSLFLLSRCGAVIGSNSTFSNLAAWFGNIPHIVESGEPMDWNYYKNRITYFENKYATFTL